MASEVKSPPSLAEIPSGVASRLGETGDVISFFRNLAALVGEATTNVFYSLRLGGGLVMAASATLYTKEACEGIYQAVQEDDSESLKLHTFNAFGTGASFMTLGYAMSVHGAADLAGAAQVSAVAGSIVSVSAPILAGCGLATGAYAAHTTGELKKFLDKEMKETTELASGVQAVKDWVQDNRVGLEELREERGPDVIEQSLAFSDSDPKAIKDFLRKRHLLFLAYSVSSDEAKEELERKIGSECVEEIEEFLKREDSEKDEAGISDLFNRINQSFRDRQPQQTLEKIKENIEKAPRKFARQTSEKCLAKVSKILNSEEPLSEAEQKQVLRTIYEANYRSNLKARMLIAVSVIGLIGAVVGFFLTGGIAALPFLIGALVWMSLDSKPLSKQIGTWFWEHRRVNILPKSLLEESDKPKMSETEFWLKTAAMVALAPVWVVPALFYLEGKRIHKRIVRYLESREENSNGNSLVIDSELDDIDSLSEPESGGEDSDDDFPPSSRLTSSHDSSDGFDAYGEKVVVESE